MIKILTEGRPLMIRLTLVVVLPSVGIIITVIMTKSSISVCVVILIIITTRISINCQILDLTTAGQYYNGDDDFSMAGEKNHD